MRESIGLVAAGILTLVLVAGCQTREAQETEGTRGEAEPAAGAMGERGGTAGTAEARQAIAAVNERWREAAVMHLPRCDRIGRRFLSDGDGRGVSSPKLPPRQALVLVPAGPRRDGGRLEVWDHLAQISSQVMPGGWLWTFAGSHASWEAGRS